MRVLIVLFLSLLMICCAAPLPQPVPLNPTPPLSLLDPCPIPGYPETVPSVRHLMALILELLAALEGCNADKAALAEIMQPEPEEHPGDPWDE